MNHVLHGVRAAKLRASLLQTMLALLDREDERGLQGALSVLHALSALPLDDPRERARCLACLRALDRRHHVNKRRQSIDSNGDQDDGEFGSDGDDEREVDIDELDSEDLDASPAVFRLSSEDVAMPPSFVYERPTPTEARRENGRAKGVSLRHCRAFLLACANEIHELDAEDPAFDYAEDTASDSAGFHLRPAPGSILHDVVSLPTRPLVARGFDYASTAADATSVATNDLCFRLRDEEMEFAVDSSDEERDDDLKADQGSQLSEVLYRAEFLTEDEDEDDEDQDILPVTPRLAPRSSFRGRYPHQEDARELDRALCHRVFSAWKRGAVARSHPKALASKLRVFRVLQRARGLSLGNLARKRRAFRQLQRLRVSPKAPYRLFPDAKPVEKQPAAWTGAAAQTAVANVVREMAVPRADVVLLLVLALFMHASI